MCRPCRTMTLAGILIDFCTLLDDLHSAVFAHIHGYINRRFIHDTAVTRVTVCRTVNSVELIPMLENLSDYTICRSCRGNTEHGIALVNESSTNGIDSAPSISLIWFWNRNLVDRRTSNLEHRPTNCTRWLICRHRWQRYNTNNRTFWRLLLLLAVGGWL